SVIIAAVMSPSGGARLLFHLSQANTVHLTVGKGVLQETEEVLRRKAPHLLGLLAQLLDEANIEVSDAPTAKQMNLAKSLIEYEPDANVLAQAISAKPDWLVSHDKEHFIGNANLNDLSFKIGTPGDVIAWLRSRTE
ncbi:MAG: PIN domain-containing protein, partial [Anaerolineales bacterium]|nr:PIN domain-containing protein [Anaerolineales bacterium]